MLASKGLGVCLNFASYSCLIMSAEDQACIFDGIDCFQLGRSVAMVLLYTLELNG